MPLHTQIFPGRTVSGNTDPIVLLHGWGFDSASMAPLVEPLRRHGDVYCVDLPGFGTSAAASFSEQQVLAALAETLPARILLVGWSLGGMLAVAYAAAYPARVSALITLAANACFVTREGWPRAMAPQVNRQFNQAFAQAPEAALQRFCALVAEGSGAGRARLKQLRGMAAAPCAPAWGQALAYLAAADNRRALAELKVPGLHLYADSDALVPASCAEATAALNPFQQVHVMTASSHALHWDEPEQVMAQIDPFLSANRPVLPLRDKSQVARSFSKAAPTYESAARLQRQVGETLLSQVPASGGCVLDLGAGTGYFSAALKARTGAEQLLALDLAEGMLRYARRHHQGADHWIGGDAEALPLAEQSVDLVFSSLAIQWCENTPALFAELYRVLKPGGQVHIATLAPGTLGELKQAWQMVDDSVHVNGFYPVAQLLEAAAGFENVSCSEHSHTLYSENILALSRELKGLGAHNVNAGRPRGLTGRRQLAALEASYERFRTPEGLPASYQVVYLTARKPVLA